MPEVLPEVLPEVFPDVFPEVFPELLPVVFPAAAARSDDWVMPVAFAIALRTAWESSFSPRSALLISAAVTLPAFSASCAWVSPAAARASFISVPTLFPAILHSSLYCLFPVRRIPPKARLHPSAPFLRGPRRVHPLYSIITSYRAILKYVSCSRRHKNVVKCSGQNFEEKGTPS